MRFTLILLLSLLMGNVLATESVEPYPHSELLVEPAQLARAENSATNVILDARPRSNYDAGHIPGALWVDHAEWSQGFGDGEDLATWTTRLARLGLTPSSQVIVYDDASAKDAARIWWILRYWGLNDVRLLNGGWSGWLRAKAPVEQQTPPNPKITRPVLQPKAERLATKDELLSSLTGQKLQIVDARSKGEFCGTQKLSNKRAGTIPGARQLEWSDLLDQKTQRFKSPAELANLFTAAGIDLASPTVTHCQSGGRSSVMAFGLELMGAQDVSNYYRSWAEWGNADDTPVVPGNPQSAK